MDVGRELLGVSFGVAVGVVDALSTLAFLDPDLGVMFELKKVLTGVEIPSLTAPFGPLSSSASGVCLRLGERYGCGDPTALGVRGILVVLVAVLMVGVNGRAFELLCLSYCIVTLLPDRWVVVEPVCGTRIMALRAPSWSEHLLKS